MMNLTQEQLQELEKGEPVRITIGNVPCILVRENTYPDEMDYSPWTEEEMNLLADEASDLIQDDLSEPL